MLHIPPAARALTAAAAAAFLVLSTATFSAAQPCGTGGTMHPTYVMRSTVYWPVPGYVWNQLNFGCTTMKFGTMPPTACDTSMFAVPFGTMGSSAYWAFLTARFGVASANVSANGCTFHCNMLSCRVRGGTGLPVELLQFGVE